MGSVIVCDRCLAECEPKVRVSVSRLPIMRGFTEFRTAAEICEECATEMREAWNKGLKSSYSIFGEAP